MVAIAEDKLESGKTLVISYGSDGQLVGVLVKDGRSLEVRCLASKQHEADGCLLLHASHAAATCGQVVVCSPDTDVLVLSVHFCLLVGVQLWFKTGTGAKTRYIQVNDLVQKLGHPVVSGIVAFHSLTGSDTTSGFTGRGRGKGEAWKVFTGNAAMFGAMSLLGNTTDVTPQMEENAREFVSGLYSKNVTSDLNMLRYKLFIQPGKEKLLPPTNDAFHQHVLKCNYQAYLWKQSLDTCSSSGR